MLNCLRLDVATGLQPVLLCLRRISSLGSLGGRDSMGSRDSMGDGSSTGTGYSSGRSPRGAYEEEEEDD